jgi:hypothetical protein
MGVGFRQSLLRIDEGVEADVRSVRQQNVRIEHAVDDRVVPTVAIAKEGSRVIVDHIHPCVVIRMLGMIRLAERDDRRIDLDRVHRFGAEAQPTSRRRSVGDGLYRSPTDKRLKQMREKAKNAT